MRQQSIGFFRSKKIARKFLSVFFWLNCFAFSHFINAQTAAPPKLETLELNAPVEKEIAAGKIQKYQINLNENQYATVIAEQRGIDVVVRVFNDTDERAMAQRDLIARPDGREEIGFVAAKAGAYRVEVEARMMPSPTGRYAVWLAEVRPPTEKEIRLEEARRLHNESYLLWKAGKFTEAIPGNERALAIRERELGAEDLDVAASVSQLALTLLELGDYEKAIALNRRSIAIREKILGPDHADLAVSLNNTGTAYRVLADYANAEQFLKRALEIKEKTLPPDHPSIASTLASLGDMYLDKGDRDKALEYDTRGLRMIEKSLGPEHPSIVLALSGIGNAYNEKGDYETAQKYYLRAVAVAEKNFGPEHPRTGTVVGDLGVSYLAQGDYAKAEPLLRRTLAITEKAVGKEHRSYGLALYKLAVLYTDTGDYEKADGLYDWAKNYEAKGDIAAALELMTRARKIREQYTPLVLATSSERQKLMYLNNNVFYETNLNISTHAKLAPDNQKALDIALTTVI